MDKKGQIQAVTGFIGIFIFVIVASSLLPTLATEISAAKDARIQVTNENQTVSNNTLTSISTTNTPIEKPTSITNETGGTIPESATAPGWQLIDASIGNITVNYTGVDLGATTIDVQLDYVYVDPAGSNLSTTDDVLLSLWPTFIIIGGLLTILAAAGLT